MILAYHNLILSFSEGSRLNLTSALVIGNDYSFRRDLAIGELERYRDRAIGEQPLPRAERYRLYLEPELIDQIVLQKRLDKDATAVNL